jgi:prepilin-type N-terminal cleavage/methylation domain-containing protein
MNRIARQDGFTLMEVALAVVVVGVGVLGMVALLSGGLDASSKASSTTQAAFLADATMNALRARSTEMAQSNRWDEFWNNFALTANEKLTIPVPPAWQGYGGAQEIKIYGNGTKQALAFLSNANNFRGSSIWNIPHGKLRYQLSVSNAPPSPSSRGLRYVTLRIWPGAGRTDNLRDENALVFYSEFANVGSL